MDLDEAATRVLKDIDDVFIKVSENTTFHRYNTDQLHIVAQKELTKPTYSLSFINKRGSYPLKCSVCGRQFEEGEKLVLLWFYLPAPVNKFLAQAYCISCFTTKIVPYFTIPDRTKRPLILQPGDKTYEGYKEE